MKNTRFTFNVTNKVTGAISNFSGFGTDEESARADAKVRYVDFELGGVTEDQVEVGACIARGDGPTIIECEGCSA